MLIAFGSSSLEKCYVLFYMGVCLLPKNVKCCVGFLLTEF